MLRRFFNKTHSKCRLEGKCSGCEWITTPFNTQHRQLQNEARQLIEEYQLEWTFEIPITECGSTGERIVTDLSFQRTGSGHVLGLYDMERENILSITECPALVPELQDLVKELDNHPPPIERASIRLRVNPHGQRGLWIDASNLDIRTLLNERTWLKHWMQDAHIEMGQRRKYVQTLGDGLSLEAPLQRQWFSTFHPINNQEYPLWSVVGGFSQPSVKGTKILIGKIFSLIEHHSLQNRWLEFGAGAGTFTLPLSTMVSSIVATETSKLAREALNTASKHAKCTNITVSPINLQRNSAQSVALIEQADTLLVDPPRSGLTHTLNTIESSSSRPLHIVYVSCYGRTLFKDGEALRKLGYKLVHLEGVDQFPNTPHCEWVSLWKHSEA